MVEGSRVAVAPVVSGMEVAMVDPASASLSVGVGSGTGTTTSVELLVDAVKLSEMLLGRVAGMSVMVDGISLVVAGSVTFALSVAGRSVTEGGDVALAPVAVATSVLFVVSGVTEESDPVVVVGTGTAVVPSAPEEVLSE